MTKEFYRTRNYEIDYTTFGGDVTLGQFCTEYPPSKGEYTKNIVRSWSFDKQCRRNAMSRTRQKNLKKGIAKWD